MATKEVTKYDPNTEAFQMRAQWKKAENCGKQWQERWSWLLDERERTIKESKAVRRAAAAALPRAVREEEDTKSLKPVPLTSTGFVGWIATKPDCQLEIYTPFVQKIPIRALDAWDYKDYAAPNAIK